MAIVGVVLSSISVPAYPTDHLFTNTMTLVRTRQALHPSRIVQHGLWHWDHTQYITTCI